MVRKTKTDKIEYISYRERDIVSRPLRWQRQGLQQTASGYGRKLTTTRMLRVGKRLYRIYTMQYGNSGSPYIIVKGKELFLRSW